MRVWQVILCVLLTQSVCSAGTNDYWQVVLRACDVDGNYAQLNSECGTKTTASDGLDGFDGLVGAVYQQCAWVACYDLGQGPAGTGYSKDYRAPVTDTAKTWNLRLRVGSSWAAADVCLRLWNPSGPMDINGTIPISLKVAADPTGTYSPGQVLITAWDPDKNGYQTAEAYAFTFNNAAALLGGAAIELQLTAGNASQIECSVAEARGIYAGQSVMLNRVTASSGSADLAGAWVASDGLPGLRLPSGPEVARGEVVDLSGVVAWVEGVPYLTNAVVAGRHGTTAPLFYMLTAGALGNDRRESLSYSGINVVGALCVVCGRVTARDAASGLFYVEDGSNLSDGLGPSSDPYKGVRVICGAGITPPAQNSTVRVTGIRSVQKHVLAQDAIVNGEMRSAGTTLYVPVVLVRDAGDILPVAP